MISDILSLRWLHCAGYEIRLPCGKTIVTDPFLTTQDFGGFTWENIEGADYILVTHTHGDHTSDVGNLVEKFRSQVCRQVNQEYQKMGIRARMVYPEKFHWVDLKMVAELR